MHPTLAALLAALSTLNPAGTPDLDSDGDGLSDFQEAHKYGTSPTTRDSDGDGIPDGDWRERREFAYTIRSVVRVLRPVTPELLSDDYQDARVLDEAPEWVLLEVIHYPLNTVAETIAGDSRWREDAGRWNEYLEPGPTANWDVALRDELIGALKADGIDAAALDDVNLVRRTCAWLLARAKYQDGFTTFSAHFEDGKATLLPELAAAVQAEAARAGRTTAEQWDRELFAKGMFANRMHGSCSSTAIYFCGCLRALGIPTRIVLCIPLVDASNARQMRLASRGLTHYRVRQTVLDGLDALGGSWTSHTFNEVFVGGRWHRLNYNFLGQNTLDENYLGLMTHVATFRDWADARMAKTIGLRQTLQRTHDVFGGPNPYAALAVSDRFGAHSEIRNERATADEPIRLLTIEKAYWYESPERPASVDMRLDDPDGAGHLFVHVREGRRGGEQRQYADFWREVDRTFTLHADGRPDVSAKAARGYWSDSDAGIQEFYLRIDPAELRRMVNGVAYRLIPRNAETDFRWDVTGDVTIVRGGAPAPDPATLSIDAALWADASDLPAELKQNLAKGGQYCLLAHPTEWNGFDALRRFTEEADDGFDLAADGYPTLSLFASQGGITNGDGSTRWVVLSLDPDDRRKLASGVAYTLCPRNGKPSRRWIVSPGVTVRRE